MVYEELTVQVRRIPYVKNLGLELWLISFALVLALGVLTSYILAVTNEDVRAALPYISDTGAIRPESCVFTLACSCAATLIFVISFIHYKNYVYMLAKYNVEGRLWHRLNGTAFLIALTAGVGLLLVASFQDNSSLLTIHYVGAGLVFGGGVSYAFLVTIVGRHMAKNQRFSLKIFNFRFILCFLALLVLIVFAVSTPISAEKFHDQHKNGSTQYDRLHWSPSDKGYAEHIVSTGSEWVMSVILVFLFLTFVGEFHQIKMEVVVSVRRRYEYESISGTNNSS